MQPWTLARSPLDMSAPAPVMSVEPGIARSADAATHTPLEQTWPSGQLGLSAGQMTWTLDGSGRHPASRTASRVVVVGRMTPPTAKANRDGEVEATSVRRRRQARVWHGRSAFHRAGNSRRGVSSERRAAPPGRRQSQPGAAPQDRW